MSQMQSYLFAVSKKRATHTDILRLSHIISVLDEAVRDIVDISAERAEGQPVDEEMGEAMAIAAARAFIKTEALADGWMPPQRKRRGATDGRSDTSS